MTSSDAQTEAPAVKGERLFDHHMWWILVLGICGIAVYQMFKYQAFPAASIDIKKPRLEIQAQAKMLAPTLGYKKEGLIESTVFDSDESAKSFLEHEYPQEEANKLMSAEIPVWSWQTRFCKEFDQEEFKTWISPQGKLVSFDHDVPNDFEIKSLTHEEAKQVALDFIKSSEPDAAKFTTLVRDEAYTKPKREDHSFTWENQSTDYKSAHIRIYIYVSGNQITEYNKYLHVPDSWERKYDTMRSYNELFSQFAFFFIYLFQTVSFLVIVWGVITKNVRWRPVIFGSLLLGGISALDYLNHLPSLIADYSPTTSFNNFIIRLFISATTGFIGNALMGASIFGGAEICYRKLFPNKVSFEKVLSLRGLTHKRIVRAVIVGHMLVGVHLGWIVLYYVLGKKFNFWCPLGVESHEVLSNVVPFVSAVALGVTASFEEELACRVIGIGIGTKLFKNFWLANLFQAVAWGFAHSWYPQEPAYARGLELTVVGLLQGWILRRYGIVAVITEHYLLDAFMYVESFLYSSVPALKLSVIPALIPALLIVGSALLLSRGKMDKGDDLDNDKIPLLKPPPPPVEEAPPPVEYTPLSKKVRINLLVICMLACLSAVFVPWTNGVNSDARLKIGREEAIASAREVMKKHDIDPAGWMETSYCGSSGVSDAFQYMFEKTDADIVKKIYDETRRGFYWSVRFFKPLKSEEYEIYLDGAGREVSFGITREEDDPGASLKSDEARALAEKYLKETHPELPDYKFKQISSQKRKNRIDYTVEFTYPSLRVAEADCLISISVTGDQVGDYTQRWEVPDSWTFERDKRTAKDEWLSHLRTATLFGSILVFIFWCYSVLRTGAIRFRAPIILTCVYLIITLLSKLNNFVTFFTNYPTTKPLNSFIVGNMVDMGQALFAEGAAVLIVLAVALGAFRIICPRAPMIPFFKFAFGKTGPEGPEAKNERLNIWYDAVLVAYATLAFNMIVTQLHGLVSRAISPSVPVDSIGSITELTGVYVPVADVVLTALKMAPMGLCGIIIAVGLAGKFAPGFFRVIGIGLAVILIMTSGERYWQDYSVSVIQGFLILLYMYVVIVQLARTNYITYGLVFIMVSIIPVSRSVALNGPTLFVPELIAFTIMLLAPAFYVIALRLKNLRG